jgi:hypothetical protein
VEHGFHRRCAVQWGAISVFNWGNFGFLTEFYRVRILGLLTNLIADNGY